MWIKKALIVGSGAAGMATAVELSKRGVAVDLIETGSSTPTDSLAMSLGGGALRACRMLGILDAVMEYGAVSDGVDIYDDVALQLHRLPTARTAGATVPGGGAIASAVFSAVLAQAAISAGARLRFNCTLLSASQDRDGVQVQLSDGSEKAYDVMIGADGRDSSVRTACFPGARMFRYGEHAVWQAQVPRPASITRATIWLASTSKLGVSPISAREMLLYIYDGRPEARIPFDRPCATRPHSLLSKFNVPAIQDMCAAAPVDLTGQSHGGRLMAPPWSHGRIVLLGKAIHEGLPHVAFGDGLCLEDGIVLAQQLGRHPDLREGLAAFEARRWRRCRMVIENSMRLAEVMLGSAARAKHVHCIRDTLLALNLPI